MTSLNKTMVAGLALAGAAVVGGAGGSLLSSVAANADTAATTTATTAATSSTAPSAPDQSQGGHVGANGTREVLLTGDTKTKAEAAAKAAVPGGTILRSETDAEGAAYEVHMTKSDGTAVTVKLDSSFKVTGTEDGPDGHGGEQGMSQGSNSGA
jgi:uncharacterized membrane protein YkoI